MSTGAEEFVWRTLPDGRFPNDRFEHVSGGCIECQGPWRWSAWNLYGKPLGEKFSSKVAAQEAVESNAEEIGRCWWRYLDLLPKENDPGCSTTTCNHAWSLHGNDDGSCSAPDCHCTDYNHEPPGRHPRP